MIVMYIILLWQHNYSIDLTTSVHLLHVIYLTCAQGQVRGT